MFRIEIVAKLEPFGDNPQLSDGLLDGVVAQLQETTAAADVAAGLDKLSRKAWVRFNLEGHDDMLDAMRRGLDLFEAANQGWYYNFYKIGGEVKAGFDFEIYRISIIAKGI